MESRIQIPSISFSSFRLRFCHLHLCYSCRSFKHCTNFTNKATHRIFNTNFSVFLLHSNWLRILTFLAVILLRFIGGLLFCCTLSTTVIKKLCRNETELAYWLYIIFESRCFQGRCRIPTPFTSWLIRTWETCIRSTQSADLWVSFWRSELQVILLRWLTTRTPKASTGRTSFFVQ